MVEPKGKFYYDNLLWNQNVTAKPNVAWVADITTLELLDNRKAYVFLCIDIRTNIIVASHISKTTIKSSNITKCLEKAVNQRLKPTVSGETKLIIHTDRGTQFSSKIFKNFIRKYQNYF